jgi:hypothetical protein
MENSNMDEVTLPILHTNDIESDNECPICLSTLNTQDIVIMNCCKKRIHANCYIRWLLVKKECPMCRNPIYTFNSLEGYPTAEQLIPYEHQMTREVIVFRYPQYRPSLLIPALTSSTFLIIILIYQYKQYVDGNIKN